MNVGGDSRLGVVSAFDAAVGLGQIAGDGEDMVGFHCVAIADGSRTIEVGTAVAYRLVAGLHGRWEAAGIVPAPEVTPTAAR